MNPRSSPSLRKPLVSDSEWHAHTWHHDWGMRLLIILISLNHNYWDVEEMARLLSLEPNKVKSARSGKYAS